MKINKKIKTLRMQRRWTQSELSKVSGISQPAISQFEKYNRLPSFTTLQRLALAFGVSADYFLGI